MRKFLLVIFLLLSSCSYALELPDYVSEWKCVNENITTLILDANNENLGRIIYRDYVRESPKGSLQIILTEGKGTGNLYVPDSVNNSQGFMPPEGSYKILSISGHKSILESQSFMPLVLAVSAGDNVILTIESSSLNENELVNFAEEILSSWSSTK